MGQNEYLPGMLRVLLLGELAQRPGYGYAIARAIELHSGGKLTVQPESLYPVLHRLEQEGLASASWEQGDNGRPRKVYTITSKGRKQWDKARAGFTEASQGALNVIAGLSGEAAR
jgi:PadR family transcriptional regulator, regulatory protein PadR